MARRILLSAYAAVSTAVAMAGCAGSPVTTPPTGSAPAPPSTAGSPGAPTSQATTGAGAGSAGTPECVLANLTVTTGQGGAGAGHYSIVLVFLNKGSSTCQMTGYPGVAGLDANGTQVTQARRTPSGYLGGLTDPAGTPSTVDLAPGVSASALVEGTNVPSGNATSCPVYHGLLVTPPDETHSVRIDVTANGCDGLQIHPVVPGDRGSQVR